jgi:hypothetical protein
VLERDHVQIVAGGPGGDGLREAIRRVDGAAAWRAITGVVRDGAGGAVAGAWVHALTQSGGYLGRAAADASGAFVIHAPAEPVKLVAQMRGYPAHAGVEVGAAASTIDLAFAPHARLTVTATDEAKGEPLPVRVQVIPTVPLAASPREYGAHDEGRGRLHQAFGATEITFVVPAGEHRVVVSRGPEWELLDTKVTVAAGETKGVAAKLARSVDSTGWMCADFHAHTHFSADSQDAPAFKVAAAVAEGLDIAAVSDHEWVTDPHPNVQALGLQNWAFGFPSLELTTFSWGHFGVLPILPRTDAVNDGAIDWIDKSPSEVFAAVDALAEKPLLVVNHPRADSFGGYLSAAAYKRDTGAGDPKLWSDNFDALEAFNGSDFEANRAKSVADWFSFLDRGRDVWVLGSSDNHEVRDDGFAYPRSCIWFGHDDPTKLSAAVVRDALASGAITVSGGILVLATGPGGERPGQTVHVSAAAADVKVVVQAPSWVPVTTLETIVDGKTLSATALQPSGSGPGKRFEQTVQVPVDTARPRSWVVFHARGDGDLGAVYPGSKAFGVSNALFLQSP